MKLDTKQNAFWKFRTLRSGEGFPLGTRCELSSRTTWYATTTVIEGEFPTSTYLVAINDMGELHRTVAEHTIERYWKSEKA